MNVLMFGWEFPPFISGGLGVACRGIADGLKKQGVGITFVLPTTRGKAIEPGFRVLAADHVRLSPVTKKMFKKGAVQTSEWASVFSGASTYDSASYAQGRSALSQSEEQVHRIFGSQNRCSVLDFSGNYGRNLHEEVAQYSIVGEFLGLTEEFDVIHAHDWLTFPAGVRAKTASGKPLVVHVHATEYDRSGDSMNMAVYDIEKHGMEQADKIIAVSYYTKNIIVNRYGIHPEKVAVVHNAVDRERGTARGNLRKPLNEKIVLFLGRVTMQKGPDYFLETAHRVLRTMKNVRFVMAGSGDMLPRLINRMASLKIADRFHFTGFLRGIDVETMYAMSDLYVMPSVSEPFGLTAFEALLYDVPLILSRQSGVSEILKDAVLVDFWDVEKLADRIVQLLSNETLARTIVERCKEQVRHIGWESAGQKIRQVYESLSK